MEFEQRIKRKRRTVGALLSKGHLMHAKESILDGYGVERIRDLEEEDLDNLIERLREVQPAKTDAPKPVREWRHKCLRMMALCGVDTTDWNAVNAFMLDPRICGKLLPALNLEQLQRLHRKLHKVHENKQLKETRISELAQNN